jgi:hypothetical protein
MTNAKVKQSKNGECSTIMKFLKASTLFAPFLITSIIATPSRALINTTEGSNQNYQSIARQNQNTVQERKLWLINNTPYTGIITLYRPNEQYAARYVHIPPCHVRKLSATYSSKWKVRFNYNQNIYAIGNVNSNPKDKVFKVKASDLESNEKLAGSCRDNSLKSQNVVRPANYWDELNKGLKIFQQGITNLKQGITSKNQGLTKALIPDIFDGVRNYITDGFSLGTEGLRIIQKNSAEIFGMENSTAALKAFDEVANSKTLIEANETLSTKYGATRQLDNSQFLSFKQNKQDFNQLFSYMEKPKGATERSYQIVEGELPKTAFSKYTNSSPVLSFAR